MKSKIKLLACALLLAPLTYTAIAVAETADDGNTSSAHQNAAEQTKQTHATGNESLTLQQRVEKYKTTVKTKQDAAAKKRVQAGCKAAQTGKIGTLKGRMDDLVANREEKYTHTKEHFAELTTKLKAKGVDTTTFETQVTEFGTKVDTYHTDLAKYKEAVTDLSQLDCVADPDGFKAALESARSLRAQVVKDGLAIRTYLTDTIKPTLKSLREQLAAKEGDQ